MKSGVQHAPRALSGRAAAVRSPAMGAMVIAARMTQATHAAGTLRPLFILESPAKKPYPPEMTIRRPRVAGSPAYHVVMLAELAVELVATAAQPTWIGHAPGDDASRLVVAEKAGRIRVIDDGLLLTEPFLDIASLVVSNQSEQGLLGVAFHPDYESNGFFYVTYTRPSDDAVVVERYMVSADPDIADAGSALTILVIPQPGVVHNGGWIDFGPDRFLYLALGDGPGADAQDLGILLGKVLRIDVDCDDFPGDDGRNYGIPADNPFVGTGAAGEIWAYGLRNTWRAGFDDQTGDLYVGDVGQNAREELNFQPAASAGGENYGWRCREGTLCTGDPSCSCDDPDLVEPLFEYAHPQSSPAAIIAGVVYRGCAIPDLAGAFVFADHFVIHSGRIWRLRHDGAGAVTELVEIQDELFGSLSSTVKPASFGTDASGEIYLADILGGEIYKIVPADGSAGGCCPGDFSGDGLVGSVELLSILGNWGPCPQCPADLDGDGFVGVVDLLVLLTLWGECP